MCNGEITKRCTGMTKLTKTSSTTSSGALRTHSSTSSHASTRDPSYTPSPRKTRTPTATSTSSNNSGARNKSTQARHDPYWAWQLDNGDWEKYNDEHNSLIEGAFKFGIPSVEVSEGPWIISFTDMTQKNKDSERERRIKRVPEPEMLKSSKPALAVVEETSNELNLADSVSGEEESGKKRRHGESEKVEEKMPDSPHPPSPTKTKPKSPTSSSPAHSKDHHPAVSSSSSDSVHQILFCSLPVNYKVYFAL